MWFYFVCSRCNAKWFAHTNHADCHRCGRLATSQELITPPWLQDRSAETIDLGELRATPKSFAETPPPPLPTLINRPNP
jgi:hypothetical protein